MADKDDHNSFDERIAAWVRQELTRRKLSYSVLARILQIDRRKLKRQLDIGLPKRGNYRGWSVAFAYAISGVCGVSHSDIAVLCGVSFNPKEVEQYTDQERTARKYGYHARLVVCRVCKKVGLLLVGTHHAFVYSKQGAYEAVTIARSSSWLRARAAIGLTRSFHSTELPDSIKGSRPRLSFHHDIFLQLTAKEQAIFPSPGIFEVCGENPTGLYPDPSSN